MNGTNQVISSTLIRISNEQDYATAGNDKIFGDSVESVLNGIDRILERIDSQLAKTDSEYLEAEKRFYSEWKDYIVGANQIEQG